MIHHRDARATRKRMPPNLAEPADGGLPIRYLPLTGKRAGRVLNVAVAALGPAAVLRESFFFKLWAFLELRAPVSSR